MLSSPLIKISKGEFQGKVKDYIHANWEFVSPQDGRLSIHQH